MQCRLIGGKMDSQEVDNGDFVHRPEMRLYLGRTTKAYTPPERDFLRSLRYIYLGKSSLDGVGLYLFNGVALQEYPS